MNQFISYVHLSRMILKHVLLILLITLNLVYSIDWPSLINPDNEQRFIYYEYQDPYASPSFDIHISSHQNEDIPIAIEKNNVTSNDIPEVSVKWHDKDIDQLVTLTCHVQNRHNETSISVLDIPEDERIQYVADLLKPLVHTTLALHGSWWSYEYHHMEVMKQVRSGLLYTTEANMGYYDSNSNNWFFSSPMRSSRNVTVDIPSVTLFYSNGDLCDMTGEPRHAFVEFRCGQESKSKIVQYQEYSICKYWVLIETPLLCSDSHFAKAAVKSTPTYCRITTSSNMTLDQSTILNNKLRFISHSSSSLRSKLQRSKRDSEIPGTVTAKDPLEAILSMFGFGDSPESDLFKVVYMNGNDQGANMQDLISKFIKVMSKKQVKDQETDNDKESIENAKASPFDTLKDVFKNLVQEKTQDSHELNNRKKKKKKSR